MLNKLKNITLAALMSASFAYADGGDFFDIKMGTGTWDVDAPKGQFGDSRTNYVDLTNDFGIGEGSANYMWAEFQHAIPLIPHIRVEYAEMPFTGTLSSSLSFGGYTFDTSVESTLMLDNVDAIFFWDVGLFDDMLDLNFGLGAKVILGQLTGTVSTVTQTADIGAAAVYAYVDARFELPYGFGIEVERKWYPGGADLGDAELEFTETIAKIDYTLELAGFLKLGVEAGQREMDLDLLLPTDQVYINVGLSGTFVGAFVKLEI